MKQYRITSQDINPASNDDCYLAPDDPIWDLMPASQMGGLGSSAALAQYNNTSKPVITTNNNAEIMRERNIKPGTDAWFKLWFGRKQ
jgi:hypothetical protein